MAQHAINVDEVSQHCQVRTRRCEEEVVCQGLEFGHLGPGQAAFVGRTRESAPYTREAVVAPHQRNAVVRGQRRGAGRHGAQAGTEGTLLRARGRTIAQNNGHRDKLGRRQGGVQMGHVLEHLEMLHGGLGSQPVAARVACG